MHQFGELEATIMDRLWQLGRPALVSFSSSGPHDAALLQQALDIARPGPETDGT
jgi:hypothetical protein